MIFRAPFFLSSNMQIVNDKTFYLSFEISEGIDIC